MVGIKLSPYVCCTNSSPAEPTPPRPSSFIFLIILLPDATFRWSRHRPWLNRKEQSCGMEANAKILGSYLSSAASSNLPQGCHLANSQRSDAHQAEWWSEIFCNYKTISLLKLIRMILYPFPKQSNFWHLPLPTKEVPTTSYCDRKGQGQKGKVFGRWLGIHWKRNYFRGTENVTLINGFY